MVQCFKTNCTKGLEHSNPSKTKQDVKTMMQIDQQQQTLKAGFFKDPRAVLNGHRGG